MLAGVAVLATGVVVAQAPPKALPPVAPAPAPVDGGRPVATLYNGTVTITQEQFGKFLTDRGGADKIDQYVNIRIIEAEAARLKIEVSKQEMEASLKQDMAGIVANQDDFVKIVLPKYGKTLYEWMEDVVRPRLLLEKMCRADKRVTVSEDDLKIQFERVYGEKRQVQMILWPLGDDEKSVFNKYANARKSQDDFDSAARSQPNPSLAVNKGQVQPIGRHTPSKDKIVELTAFKLKEGEVSEVLKTQQGYVVLKLHKILPPTKTDMTNADRDQLTAAAYEERMTLEIPKKFMELKKAAMPELQYAPPREWQALTPVSGTGLMTTPGTGGVPAVQPAGK